MRTLLKNGKLIFSDSEKVTDILIKDNKIEKIGSITETVENTIDVSGMYVLPGAIDPHVHLALDTPSGKSEDDFKSGSLAAIMGGTSAIIDFVTPKRNQPLSEALNNRKLEAQNSLIDYTFHVSPIEWSDDLESQIIDLIKQGITSFKVYMAYQSSIGIDNITLEKIMKIIAKHNALLTIHAEADNEINYLRNFYANQNKLEPKYHAKSRPNNTEWQAVEQAILLAEKTGCKIYFVHISTKESAKKIEEAQNKGLKIYAETCPQYLLLNNREYKSDFKHACKYVMSPPLRTPQDNEALWLNIKNKIITTIGTDHCPFNYSKKLNGVNDFRLIPNGAGGIEYRLPLLYTFGVLENKITMSEMVNLLSTNVAEIFNLTNKGKLSEGVDADIVIWNPNSTQTINLNSQYSIADINIYENIQTKGRIEYMFLNGKMAIKNSEFMLSEYKSKFISRNIN